MLICFTPRSLYSVELFFRNPHLTLFDIGIPPVITITYLFWFVFWLFVYLSAISIALNSSFKKDQDILVLPLDLQKFDTHQQLAQDVVEHFGKVKKNK